MQMLHRAVWIKVIGTSVYYIIYPTMLKSINLYVVTEDLFPTCLNTVRTRDTGRLCE